MRRAVCQRQLSFLFHFTYCITNLIKMIFKYELRFVAFTLNIIFYLIRYTISEKKLNFGI